MVYRQSTLIPHVEFGVPVVPNANHKEVTVTIANGASQSEIIDLKTSSIVGIIMPSAWTAANLTVLVANDPADTFVPLYDDMGSEVVITAAASRAIAINSNALNLAPWSYIILHSGTAATPVNQGAARTVILSLKN